MMTGPKYANITVQLTSEDGNVFSIIGAVKTALRRGGVSTAEVTEFTEACFAAESYDEVLRLVMMEVDVA